MRFRTEKDLFTVSSHVLLNPPDVEVWKDLAVQTKTISRQNRKTSICSRDLKTDRSKGRLVSWMLLVPTEPLLPEI